MKKDITYHGDVVVFDLDDTLIRERDYCREGFRRIERTLSETAHPAATSGSFQGIADRLSALLEQRAPYFDYLEEVLTEHGLAYLMPQLVAAYRNNENAILPLKEGMAPLLDELAKRGTVMGVITDGRSATQRCKLQCAGLYRYFDPDNILISEETGHDKTTPHNFRHFVSRYPEARRFIYIGDNERKDFFIPNMLGWHTAKLKWENDNVHEDFTNPDKMSRPAAIIDNPMAIIGLIDTKSNLAT